MSGLSADAGYAEVGIPFLFKLDRAFVIRRAWEEATGAVVALQVPEQPVN
jgi:hypothetical protein